MSEPLFQRAGAQGSGLRAQGNYPEPGAPSPEPEAVACLERDQLVAVECCPACTSAVWERLDQPFPDNRYLKMLRRLGAPLESVRLVRCRGCESVYRSPWLSAEAMEPIYRSEQPCHPAGMDRVTTPGAPLEHGYVRGGAGRLNRFFQRHVRPFERYGELGCPVWGLLPYYEQPRYRMLAGAVELGDGARLFGRSVSDIMRTQQPAVRALRNLALMRSVKTPSALWWFAHGTQTFWGEACTFQGRACHEVLRARQLTKSGADRGVSGDPLDVLSVIDFLDHHHDPAEILRPWATQTRFLFLWTHGTDPRHWSVQHAVNFTGLGLSYLARRCGFEMVARYPDARQHDDFGVLLRSAQIDQA